MSTDESLYHAIPQVKGKTSHKTIDDKTYSSKNIIVSLSVASNSLGLIGKIDLYKPQERLLVERKYQLKTIYQGQLYQLWSQYYCMLEMGFPIEQIEFYEISRNRRIPIPLPGHKEHEELKNIIYRMRNYNPRKPIPYNINKCRHCIYCNLCDKIEIENVYT